MDASDKPKNGRPVVALMGEFSAGKSTLANIMLGESTSPVQVTATQQPPIWYSYGAGTAKAIDRAGVAWDVDLSEIDKIDRSQVVCIRVQLEADVLEMMDIIDMPGISDPNTPPEVWQRLIGNADHVIWCTHAIQAWRQSEAATWDEFSPSLHDKSILLLTRFDKVRNEQDRRRVVSRVKSETEGLFAAVIPISLLQASQAGDDQEIWEASGAELFSDTLVDMVVGGQRKRAAQNGHQRRERPLLRPVTRNPVQETKPQGEAGAPADANVRRVVPRRVVVTRRASSAATARPPAAARPSA